MPELTHLEADTPTAEVLETLRRDGAVILDNALTADATDRVAAEIKPFVDATAPGVDSFSGVKTTRTGALVARSAACRDLVTDATVLATAKEFLSPWCERIQLHLTQVIRIGPGEAAQEIHRDRWAWGTHLSNLEPQLNTIWAISDFTEENGATRVVPGSVEWPDSRRPEENEICAATMRSGSVLIYTGSVFHGGGANRSSADRIGINLTYTLGWLRQEENQYLSCPPEIARDFDPALTDLLGYTVGSYALGYYTPPLPAGEGPGTTGPEYALGRTEATSEFGGDDMFESLLAATQK